MQLLNRLKTVAAANSFHLLEVPHCIISTIAFTGDISREENWFGGLGVYIATNLSQGSRALS